MKKLIAAFLLLATVNSSLAANENFEYYHVEIIVFLHNNADYRNEEWSVTNGASESKKYNIKLQVNNNDKLAIENDSEHPTVIADKRLTKEFDSLKANPNYTPILHLAWKTPINYGDVIDLFIKEESPVGLRDELDTNHSAFNFPYLHGAIHINRLRYVHINTNFDINLPLVLEHKREKILSFEELQSDYGTKHPDYIVKTFHANGERKKIRSNELHYIDDPVIGVLIKFNKDVG